MTVEQIPGEMRWWVSSESRDINHLVDLQYMDNEWSKPKPVCSCEQCQARGKVCKHVLFLVSELLKRI